MSALRRLAQITGLVALFALGTALILEATDIVGDKWRRELADIVADVTFPGWELWALTLAGVGAAVVGVMLVAAQLAPPKKGLQSMHEVYSGPDGDTRIRGRAAIAAARHEAGSIEGVVAVDARVKKKAMTVEIQIDDRADLALVETTVRERLGHEFWINLGLADFSVNLLVTHHPRPPRVR